MICCSGYPEKIFWKFSMVGQNDLEFFFLISIILPNIVIQQNFFKNEIFRHAVLYKYLEKIKKAFFLKEYEMKFKYVNRFWPNLTQVFLGSISLHIFIFPNSNSFSNSVLFRLILHIRYTVKGKLDEVKNVIIFKFF